jgi:AraC-like DNA-binding protein
MRQSAVITRHPTGSGDELLRWISSFATDEGCNRVLYPGVHFYRVSRPVAFRKTTTFGPTLTVAVQGRKRVRLGSCELSYDPSHYLVVTGESDLEGEVVEASPERPYLAVCVEVPAETIAKILISETTAQPVSEGAPAFIAGLDDPVRSTLVRLLSAIADPLERKIVAPLVLEELVFRLLRTEASNLLRSAAGSGADGENIREAMRFMRANAARALSVDAVARHVAMSPSHFAHRFRAVARVSPMRFLKQVRLDNARSLLLAGGVRIGEVAERVGYESASHFTRDFKSYFGLPPAAYLKRARQP